MRYTCAIYVYSGLACSRYAVGPSRLAVARFQSCKQISSLNDALIPSHSPSSILIAPKRCPWEYEGGGAGGASAVQDTTNMCTARVGLWVELDKYQQRKKCILLYYIHSTITSENMGQFPTKNGALLSVWCCQYARQPHSCMCISNLTCEYFTMNFTCN